MSRTIPQGSAKEMAPGRVAADAMMQWRTKVTNEQADQILKELEMLRKLRLLELFDKGYSQARLAQVLGVSQPTISRMVPKVSVQKG